MDFFWGSLAPLSLFAAFGLAVLATGFMIWSTEGSSRTLLALGILVFFAGIILLHPTQYYLVRSRLEHPLTRLEHELRGELPWRPEGDMLLGKLRVAVQVVRDSANDSAEALATEREKVAALQARVDEQVAADRFGARVADVLRATERVDQFAAESARLIREVWPAEHVVLLQRDELSTELQVLYQDLDGDPVMLHHSDNGAPRYRKASLPGPIKEALRRGFFAESGLAGSQDPAFPTGRSFVAIALDHRGPGAGVLLAVSPALVTPTAETLRRAQPLFSIGFSRSLYLREVEEAAVRDALTGTYTYDHFLSLLRHEVARSNRYSRPLACLVVDVDGLRRINESHGARTGDRVIAEVAQVVQAAIRSSDMLARISGGRLALLLPETVEEASKVVAERVITKVQEHPFIVQRSVVERVTVSVGIALHPPHGVTALTLVDAAHVALSEAKEAGRNCYSLLEAPARPENDTESPAT